MSLAGFVIPSVKIPMELENLLCGKFFQCVYGVSLILVPHLCEIASGFLLRLCISVRVYVPGVSLRECVRSLLSWIARLTAKCQHNLHLRGAAFVRSSGTVSMYFREAKSTHNRLFADHAGGHFAHVDMDVVLRSFDLRVPCSKLVVAGITRCPDPELIA